MTDYAVLHVMLLEHGNHMEEDSMGVATRKSAGYANAVACFWTLEAQGIYALMVLIGVSMGKVKHP